MMSRHTKISHYVAAERTINQSWIDKSDKNGCLSSFEGNLKIKALYGKRILQKKPPHGLYDHISK